MHEDTIEALSDDGQKHAIAQMLRGNISPEMAAMYCLQSRPDVGLLLHELGAPMAPGRSAATRAGIAGLVEFIKTNHAGCCRIATMLASGKDTDAPAKSVAEGIAFCRNLFDWSVAQSEEASVALYTFGNPAILDAATTEIVDFLRRVKVVGSDLDLLEIGCGTGRFQEALARELNSITGIDVSTGMLAVARERCAGLPNVTLAACSGLDLGMFPDASFDVALGVDSFPYLYQSGMALVERHFAEIARVLRPRGTLVILEFSYRGDADADRREIGRLAAEFGFTVTLNGSSPFRIWDGTAFVLVRNSG